MAYSQTDLHKEQMLNCLRQNSSFVRALSAVPAVVATNMYRGRLPESPVPVVRPPIDMYRARLYESSVRATSLQGSINWPNGVSSKENSENPFFTAIREGDVNKVETYISEGASLNSLQVVKNNNVYSIPLNHAIKNNQLKIVKVLVKKGARIHPYARTSNTTLPSVTTPDSVIAPLQNTALLNNLEIFKFLINRGADVHFEEGITMRNLIENNKIEMLQCLTELKTNLNRTYKDGETPLKLAIKQGNVEIVKWMLENGAKHSVPGALPEAIAKGSIEILRSLLEHFPDVNFKYSNGTTCLIKAIESDKREIIEEILEHKADINLISSNGTSPLIRAIELDKLNLAMFLLDKGADPNLEDGKGQLPLTLASRLTDVAFFKKLLELTNDHTKVDDKMPLLFHCIKDRNMEDVKYIFEKTGINANLKNEWGHTPLLVSAEMDYYEMCRYFVEKGANVNEVDGNGITALFIASMKSNFDLFEYLVSNGADLENSNLNEVAKENVNFAIYLETIRRKREEEKKKNIDGGEVSFSRNEKTERNESVAQDGYVVL